MWGQRSQCRVSLGKAGGASCRARAPQARGNQPEKESRTRKPFLFKGAALMCWSLSMQVTAGPSQLLGRRIWEGQLSPSGICVSESRCCAAQDDCPREGSVPQIFHLRSKASPLDLCFSFSLDGIGTFMCPGAPTRAILQRNRFPLLPSLYSY